MKERLVILLCLLCFTTRYSHAQNLVPNPSFEDTLECPDFPGQVSRASGWYVAENTPDYFHTCCNNVHPDCGVPNNTFGARNAATGIAYCGIFTYLLYPPPEYKEKIGIELTTSLAIGTRYYVSMKISSVNTSFSQVVNGANNKLGMLLSTFKYDLNNLPPNNNFSQFYSDSIITDSVGWTTIKGSFIADSAYTFLTIGNFFDNQHTDTIRYWYINGNNELVAYYFIDDICITTDNAGCDFSTYINTPSSENPFLVFPNPVSNALTIKTKFIGINSIQLFNVDGQNVFRQKYVQTNETIKVDTNHLANGIYLLQINSGQNVYSQKIIILKS
jgi:hypothetical protein